MEATVTNTSKIVQRIQKLLSLAENNSSVEEASLAAAQAQELMFKFQIRSEDLILPESAPEPVEDGEVLFTPRYETWKGRLLFNLALSMGANMYCSYGYRNGRPVRSYRVVGLESVVQTVQYMGAYLINEINALTERAWAGSGQAPSSHVSHGKTWKNNFRLGAVQVISQRLRESRQAQEAQVKTDLAKSKNDGSDSLGLVLYQTDQLRQEQAYAKVAKEKGLRSRSESSTRYNVSAFQQGAAAGSTISLGGGKGLSSPKTQLPK